MQCSDPLLPYNALDSTERATMMTRFDPPFPAFDVWEKMSESEQDALIAGMERARRRSEALFGVLIAVLLVAAISGALYLASMVRL
jgi:hypothetical protein